MELDSPTGKQELDDTLKQEVRKIRDGFIKFGLPDHMYAGVVAWVLWGTVPGDFLSNVLRNDLKGAFAFADELNRSRLGAWAQLLFISVPSGCQGSEDKFNEWRRIGGLKGLLLRDEEKADD